MKAHDMTNARLVKELKTAVSKHADPAPIGTPSLERLRGELFKRIQDGRILIEVSPKGARVTT